METPGGLSFAAESYTILPLPTEQGFPRYNENRIARSAGDAIFKTHLTMTELHSAVGWSSFDGNGSPAKIVVEPVPGSSCDSNAGNAFFHGGLDRFAPRDSVVVCDPQTGDFEASACLDMIAHEWGHGVLFAVEYPRQTYEQAQLHEGFADTLGYGVEWKAETPGPGWLSPETADWAFGEDKNPPLWEPVRRLDLDDGAWGYSYHLGDPPGPGGSHLTGHQLAVAMYLAAEGVENPVCIRMPGLQGCGSPVTQMPGATLEESIDKTVDVFWSVMVMYLDETDNWETVYSKAKFAAWELYRVNLPPDCDEALVEQHAIEEAFIAVGRGEVTDDFCECECGS